MVNLIGAFVQLGDRLFLQYAASTGPTDMSGFLLVEERPGKAPRPYQITLNSFTADRTLQVNEAESLRIEGAGKIVGGGIQGSAGGLKRGQCYCLLILARESGPDMTLAKGYLYATNPIGLGEMEESVEGRGYCSWVQVFHDRAGNAAAVDQTLSATNALRKVFGFIWFYHSSGDAATRTVPQPTILNLGPTKPTGWTTSGNTGLQVAFFTSNITLTADEEGLFYANCLEGADGFASRNDNGTLSDEASSTQANPLPLLILEDDLGVFRFPAITNGNVNDTHSAYLLVEEWISI